MCRDRKRGLAGIITIQRLAKLAKHVAAEAPNSMKDRTFLDVDLVRAADLPGMKRRHAEQVGDLARRVPHAGLAVIRPIRAESMSFEPAFPSSVQVRRARSGIGSPADDCGFKSRI
jgi:hypothetical protein